MVAYDIGPVIGIEGEKEFKQAIDKNLLEYCVKGCKSGESIPYLKAWLKGWDHVNLGVIK